jgi:hypothetical protein
VPQDRVRPPLGLRLEHRACDRDLVSDLSQMDAPGGLGCDSKE